MKKLALSAAVVLAAGLTLAPSAQATNDAGAAKAANTKVEIGKTKLGETTVTISGTVKSPKGKCEVKRKVVLRQVDQGTTVGSDRTNRQGQWSVTFKQSEVEPGTFRATAPRIGGCKAGSDQEGVGG